MKALLFDPKPYHWLAGKTLGRLRPGMFAARLSGLRMVDIPPPELPGPKWVRLRTVMGGVCGTDIALVRHRQHPGSMLRAFVQFPVVLGHENVAVIDEVGPVARQLGWQVGQRVCVEPMLSCHVRGVDPPCLACAEGRFSICQRLDEPPLPPGMMIGYNHFTGGSWGEYFVAHHWQLHRVPDALPNDVAILTDPLACAVHAVLRRMPQSGETALVLGGGIVGLGVVAAIRALAQRARIVCVVRHPHQVEQVRQYGADAAVAWRRREGLGARYRALAEVAGARIVPGAYGNQAVLGGFDLVYDCVGTGQSLTDAMKWARSGGTVLQVGTPGISFVEVTPLWMSELTVHGCYGRQIETFENRKMHTYQVVFELVQSCRLRPGGLLTHVFALQEYRQALAALADRRSSKLVKAAFVMSAR
ncbi:MAG TPA: alcohol dehydrogenase catalytic domain-containing protein [Phycisphaerae bacterium]|nr:alcohol dehydrogenase catalytic domain-containing protein [Phycisphaerae bacterium]